MSKSTKPHPCFYNNDYSYLVNLSTEEKYTTSITNHYAARYYKEGIEDMIPERWSKEVRRYHFEALNGIHHWEEDIIDFFKAKNECRNRRKRLFRLKDQIKYLPRLSVNDVEDVYLLQVQDKLHHLPLEFVKDFNNALLIKPIMFFEGIDQRILFTMTETHKVAVYLNQYNIKSLMKLSEVKKFCDGTLVKIQENLIDMLSKNKLGSGNKRLKGRDWIDYDVKSSKAKQNQIDENTQAQ
ncbi:hypothetical protein Tco_0432731 [Tanacetum coccineum]